MPTKDKTKKRKAEKLRRKSWKPDEPKYTVVNHIAPEVVTPPKEITVGGLEIKTDRDPEEVAAEIVAAMVLEHDPAPEQPVDVAPLEIQPRWEVVYRDGEYQVVDHMTNFVAVVGGRSQHGSEAGNYAKELNAATMAIDNLVWSEQVTRANVLYTTEREHDRFFLIESSTTLGEWAMFDKVTSLIHPLESDSGLELDALVKEVDFFNSHPQASLQDCAEEAIYSKERHWLTREEWVAPPPEDEPPQPAEPNPFDYVPPAGSIPYAGPGEQYMVNTETLAEKAPAPAAAATETDEQPEVKVLVVSSATWAWGGIVGEVLQAYWNRVGNPPMVLYTSGSGRGAEQAAVKLAEAVDGVRHEVLPDNLIGNADVDYAFGFISNFSTGASAIVDYLGVIGVPTHVIREESAKVDDPWADR